jgi:hypothetical protein
VGGAGQLTAVGPVNTLNGFPAWYQDKAGTRVEPCLDRDDALCGFLPGDIPNAGPIAFPGNFPEEFFYQVVGATLTGPGTFKATLTIGLEGRSPTAPPSPATSRCSPAPGSW